MLYNVHQYHCVPDALCQSLLSHIHHLFFFNDTATTEIYTLSLHDALPISTTVRVSGWFGNPSGSGCSLPSRSEEHTSELQSQSNLVCRLLLEKKNNSTVNKVNIHDEGCVVRGFMCVKLDIVL